MKKITDVDINMALKDPKLDNIIWYDARNKNKFNLCGTVTDNYNRFSDDTLELLKDVSEAVCWLSHHSSGLQLKFETDSLKVLIDVALAASHDMDHMTATAQCGFDIYFYDEIVSKYVLLQTTRFDRSQTEYQCELSQLYNYTNEKKMRKYVINFPLYQQVNSVKIGLEQSSQVKPVYFKNPGVITHYGTSIAQGGCVSRPGMMYTNILSRYLDTEILNYGFSGCAMCESEIGEVLGKIPNQKLFIIDAEANAGCSDIMEHNLEKFINAYKKNSPNVPIILVTRCKFHFDKYDQKRIELNKFYIEFTKKLVEKYQLQGHKMYFLDGSNFFDGFNLDYTEFTVDGVHPTDFGTYLIAMSYLRKIKEVLE